MNLLSIEHFEDYTHQATLIYLNEEANIRELISQLVEDLNEQLPAADGTFGISALPVNGLIVRMLGYKAEQLFELLKKIAAMLNASKEIVTIKPKAYVV